jgi:hypothetical protein
LVDEHQQLVLFPRQHVKLPLVAEQIQNTR